MKLSIQDIALAFSGGKFDKVYPFLTEETQWNIVGENILQGKAAITQFCERTAAYFSEVVTVFTMSNLVVGENHVAIDGEAEFITKDGKRSKIQSCDVYRFESGMLQQINSYCIRAKKL
jgi:hypothetical protein